MIAIPAVDLREGACVQLVGGDFSNERVRLADPVAVAREWTRYGFRRLHVVDLDAATGSRVERGSRDRASARNTGRAPGRRRRAKHDGRSMN